MALATAASAMALESLSVMDWVMRSALAMIRVARLGSVAAMALATAARAVAFW